MNLQKKSNEVYSKVEGTHKRLGKLALLELYCDIANKCLLVIGTSGTGKSAILKFLEKQVGREKLLLDAITISGLRHIQKKLDGKNITILVDDISKGGTEYAQIATIVTLGELSYTGHIIKITQQYAISIRDFKGAVIINGQPLIIKRILSVPEFETDIRDKVIRYYHLPRPTSPTLHPPKNDITIQYGIDKIKIPQEILNSPTYIKALENFKSEFTLSRAIQHLNDLIRAVALFEEKQEVDEKDVNVIENLSRNFRLEHEIYNKKDLEGPRQLDVNVIPLLSIISTYKTRNIEEIENEFQVKRARVYEIVKELEHIAQFKEKTLIPTKYAENLLKYIGEWSE
ncbi:MAG: hypothetical protein QXS21_05980 [Thermoproteota archaeon]